MPDVAFVDLGEHRLRDLDGTHHLFQVVVPGLQTEFPSLGSMSRYVTTLPTQRTELIGRDELVAGIRALLLEQRLVTLLGPGGVGKTRVAVEVAGQELENYPDGVFFVDFTTAASDADVVAALVSGIRTSVPPDQAADAHLAEYFADRRALLIADNCEHVVDRVAEVLDGLLIAAPELRVLATSRETLELDGEHCLVVPSLEVDGPWIGGRGCSPNVRWPSTTRSSSTNPRHARDGRRDRSTARRHPVGHRARGRADPDSDSCADTHAPR